MTQIVNLSHTQGNTFTYPISIAASGVAVNLTGSTITMTVRKKADDSAYIAQGTATLANQTTNTGEATMTIPATSFNVAPGEYVYDMTWVDAAGVVTTFMK